jgi:hypothetical protein
MIATSAKTSNAKTSVPIRSARRRVEKRPEWSAPFLGELRFPFGIFIPLADF